MTLKEIKARLEEIDVEMKQVPQDRFKLMLLQMERAGLLTRIRKNFPNQ